MVKDTKNSTTLQKMEQRKKKVEMLTNRVGTETKGSTKMININMITNRKEGRKMREKGMIRLNMRETAEDTKQTKKLFNKILEILLMTKTTTKENDQEDQIEATKDNEEEGVAEDISIRIEINILHSSTIEDIKISIKWEARISRREAMMISK